jgi:uncharacterized protein YqhQ
MEKEKFNYGGQAVIEGVMMRGKNSLAIAFRRDPEHIGVEGWALDQSAKRPKFLKWPFIRGTVNMVDSLVMGVKTLVFSANQSLGEDEEAESLSHGEIIGTVAISLGLGIALFFLLPAFLAQMIRAWAPGRFWQNLLEGLMRIGIFLAYILSISQIKDIQRVFQYHGAEHKTIYNFESGQPLAVENARRMSRLHPRCGTSFLLLVMVVSILVYSLLPAMTLAQRLLSRLVLLPVIAGIAYEIIRLAGRRLDNPLVAAISWPGMQLQRLTTREPDDSQLEVAIAALTKVIQDDGLLPPAVDTEMAAEGAAPDGAPAAADGEAAAEAPDGAPDTSPDGAPAASAAAAEGVKGEGHAGSPQ